MKQQVQILETVAKNFTKQTCSCKYVFMILINKKHYQTNSEYKLKAKYNNKKNPNPELFDQTFKIPLVQGHPVVFGQTFCYRREEDYLFYLKSAGSHFMLFVKYS